MNDWDIHRTNIRLRKELKAALASAEEWRQVALRGQAALERLKARTAELLRKRRGH
jgi:hypothetical protein